MIRRFGLHIAIGILALWLATGIPGVYFEGEISSLALAGFVLGVINFAIKPILDILTLPLRMVTLGIFSLFLNIAIIWVVDILLLGNIFTFLPLFLTTLIIWILNIMLIRRN